MTLENMKYAPYSWSKISTFTQCPRKFKYKYIDKLPTEFKPSIHLDKGKLIHLIFELERDIEKIKVHKDFKEIKANNLLGADGIKNCFKIHDDFVKSQLGDKILKFPRAFAEMPLGLDPELNITSYSADNVLLRGYIDDARFIEDNDDVMICNDWKSGKIPQKQSWGQLLYYSIGLFSKTPVEKILLNYVYVEHDHLESKIVYRKDLEKYRTALYKTIDVIESCPDYHKEENGLCNFCDYEEICMQEL